MALPKNQIRSFGTIEQHEHEDNAHARRVLPVDELGNPINSDNRFPVDVIISGESSPDTPTTARVTAALANTEYSYALPNRTARIKIRAESFARIQISFASGSSGTDYWTIMPGSVYEDEGLDLTGKTIYFQSSIAGVSIQFFTWAY